MQLSFGNERVLYVAGYRGRDLDAFVRLANRLGVVQVVDVREHATSRRPGFGKTSLTRALGAAGIAYVHVPDADDPHRHDDVPPDERRARYQRHLDEHPDVVARVAAVVRGKTSLLLGFERDFAASHRALLAERVAAREGLRVVAA